MVEKKTTIPLVTRVTAKNFRSLEDVDVKLGPLTVLVGPNASGKSNVVDVLRFVADTFRNGLDSAIADRHGIGAIRRWSAKGRPYDVEIGLEFQDGEHTFHYRFVLGSKLRGEYQVKEEYLNVEGGSRREKLLEVETRNGRLVTPKPESADSDFPERRISPTELAMRWPQRWFFPHPEAPSTSEVVRSLFSFQSYCSGMQFYHL